LSECYPVLRKQGVPRVVVPNLQTIVADYVSGSTDARDLLSNLTCATADADGALKERPGWLFRPSHRCMYDSSALMSALREPGFTATLCAPCEGRLHALATVDLNRQHLAGALVVEDTRPA